MSATPTAIFFANKLKSAIRIDNSATAFTERNDCLSVGLKLEGQLERTCPKHIRLVTRSLGNNNNDKAKCSATGRFA